jgi:hypothetical protein
MPTHGYTIDEVKPKLLTLDTVRETLAATEPLGTIQTPAGDDIRFRLQDDWKDLLGSKNGTELINVYVDIKGHDELQLTKDAFYKTAAHCKLSETVFTTYPAEYIERMINWQFREGKVGKEFKVLTLDSKYVAGIVNATWTPFSNLRLMDALLDGIEAKYGKGEVFADYKFNHSLARTDLRLIIPEKTRIIENTKVENDIWSAGLQAKNSLAGSDQTSVDGYFFRYWCTNGAIDKRNWDDKGRNVWNRKSSGQNPEDVYEWARNQVDSILGGLEESLNHVQQMTEEVIEGDIEGILEDLAATYSLPAKIWNTVTNNMLMEDDLTMYDLMQAITSAANSDKLSPSHREQLMMIGGEVVYQANERCEACARVMPHH